MDGILIIDKPKEWTSFDVVAKLRNELGVKKIGHTGTLDPMATGVLVLCLGSATKKVQEMTGYDKEYFADITLGATTPTDDAESEITPFKTRDSKFETQSSNFEFETSSLKVPSKEIIEMALSEFKGEIMQVPPRFSAKKVQGKRAYAMARKGQEVKLEPVKVKVHELELLGYQWPVVRIRVLSGKGFYVRSLARDLGKMLGVGGYLSALQRTKVGPYTINQAVTIETANSASIISVS